MLAAPAAWAAEPCQANANIPGDSCSGNKPDLTNPYTGNDVYVDNTTPFERAYGGYSKTDEVKENFLTIDSDTADMEYAIGGDAGGDGGNAATENTVTIASGKKVSYVHGGFSLKGEATGNKAFITGGYVYYLRGGFTRADNGNATRNEVHIDGGEVGILQGGHSESGSATGNEVFINGGTAGSSGYVEGGEAPDATENTVTITGGTVVNIATGAYGGSRSCTGNKVFIYGGTVGGAYGCSAKGGDPTRNEVVIDGGTVKRDVRGGSNSNGSATGNTVTLASGTVGGDVLGGYSLFGGATGNTVTIAGGTVGGNVSGGICYSDTPPCDMLTDNTLNVQAKGLTVGGDVLNFDTLNFDLGTIGANDVVLDVGGTADFSKVTAAKFSFNLADGAALKPGDTITLIKAGSLNLPALPASVTACGHDFELSTTATTLTATVKEPPAPTPGGGGGSGGDSSSPTMGELGLLLSGLALAGAAAPALRRREKQGKKADTRQ